MKAHYGKEVILLVDEYDVPLAKASDNGYYEEMLNIIKTLLGMVWKSNPSLKFALVTGCLRIAKESIFTGANNLRISIISIGRRTSFGGRGQYNIIRAESRPDRIADFIYKFFRVMEMSLRIRLIAAPTNVKTIVMDKNKTIKKIFRRLCTTALKEETKR